MEILQPCTKPSKLKSDFEEIAMFFLINQGLNDPVQYTGQKRKLSTEYSILYSKWSYPIPFIYEIKISIF